MQATLKFDGVIGYKSEYKYGDFPQFVREMAEFKADSDVIINHAVDKRIELRTKEILKQVDERAEGLINKNKSLEGLLKKVTLLEDQLEEVKEAAGIGEETVSVSEGEESESGSNSETSVSLTSKSKSVNRVSQIASQIASDHKKTESRLASKSSKRSRVKSRPNT